MSRLIQELNTFSFNSPIVPFENKKMNLMSNFKVDWTNVIIIQNIAG